MDYNLFDSITSKLETEDAAFGFGFCLSGQTKTSIRCLKNEFTIQGGQSVVYYLPEINVQSEDSSKERVKRISIEIPVDRFQSFIDEDYQGAPGKLIALSEQRNPEPFRLVDKLNPWMRRTLLQIFNCSYQGPAGRFFIEAKLMELIAYKFDQLRKVGSTSRPVSKLKKDNVDRLYFARDLLSNNMAHPMGLFELARKVGMSRTKLLNGFIALFGTSPTSYLRDKRIEKARNLIDQGVMNLTEIAHLVGFSSSSHFTKVFKNYYAITPTQYAAKHSA